MALVLFIFGTASVCVCVYLVVHMCISWCISVWIQLVSGPVAQPPQRRMIHCDLPFPTLDEIAVRTR